MWLCFSNVTSRTSFLEVVFNWFPNAAVPSPLFSAGDNVICGSYDCRLAWFDLDLSTKPYKVLRWVGTGFDHSDGLEQSWRVKSLLVFALCSKRMSSLGIKAVLHNVALLTESVLCICPTRHHKKALRGVAYHRHYPLFASASDDGSVIVCHGMVYKWVQSSFSSLISLSAFRNSTLTLQYSTKKNTFTVEKIN